MLTVSSSLRKQIRIRTMTIMEGLIGSTTRLGRATPRRKTELNGVLVQTNLVVDRRKGPSDDAASFLVRVQIDRLTNSISKSEFM